MELEVKILDINEKEFISKIERLGAKFKSDNKQILYTYDLQSIYGRFLDLLILINNPESKIKINTSIQKLKLLFFEIDNLLNEEDKKELKSIIGNDNLLSNKWIRLRDTNGKATIAVKHILAKGDNKLQQMLETEIEVESIKKANELLEALGYSYKSYQEKRRITYILKSHEIDIDYWPGIPPYVEIEGTSESDLETFLKEIGYSIKDTVSCTADEVYRMYGKSMFDKRELKF